jgi:hypothetical protein
MNKLGQNPAFGPAVAAMEGVFARAAQRWFGMPKVVTGFLNFAAQPAAAGLMLPGIRWLAAAVPAFDSYDWKYGLEEESHRISAWMLGARAPQNCKRPLPARSLSFSAGLRRFARRACGNCASGSRSQFRGWLDFASEPSWPGPSLVYRPKRAQFSHRGDKLSRYSVARRRRGRSRYVRSSPSG